jgi:hypothetical protein
VTCRRKFIAHRADARYCSGRCRQRANRARQTSTDIDRQIQAARRLYWSLVRRKAEALSVPVSQVLTGEAQTVVPRDDGAGSDVYMHGRLVGTTSAGRPGWTQWGLEAAGRPFKPPPPDRDLS